MIQEIVGHNAHLLTVVTVNGLREISVLFRHRILRHPRVYCREVLLHLRDRLLANGTRETSLLVTHREHHEHCANTRRSSRCGSRDHSTRTRHACETSEGSRRKSGSRSPVCSPCIRAGRTSMCRCTCCTWDSDRSQCPIPSHAGICCKTDNGSC